MSDRDTGAADDRAPGDPEPSADDAARSGESAASPSEASDDRVGEAVPDVPPEADATDDGDTGADSDDAGADGDDAGADGVPDTGDASAGDASADDAPTGDGTSADESVDADGTGEREARAVPATDGGNGENGPAFGDDAAAPDVDESQVFDSLRDEYDPTDFEDIEPEVERQFPGEVDFDHLVAGDVDLAEGEEPWLAAEESDATDPAGGGDAPAGDARAEGYAPDGDTAVADLVADVRSGAATEEDLEALREALGLQTPRHMDVRLRHVQSRIDDLAAYIETLETFIDEEGTPIQILKRTRERLENLEGQIDVVKTGLVNARTERQSLEDRLGAVEDAVETDTGAEHIEAELTQLRQRVEDLADAAEGDGATSEEVAELRADLADALAERRDLRESVEDLREEQRRIREVFEGIAGEFAEE